MLNTPIIVYDDYEPQQVSDLIAKAKALTDFVPGAQQRIDFSLTQGQAAPDEDENCNILHIIRQGIEDGRTLRKIRWCNIDYNSGTGGVMEYVCLWDDEPDIDNWRGPPQNPFTDILPGESLHPRCRIFKWAGVNKEELRTVLQRPRVRRKRTAS